MLLTAVSALVILFASGAAAKGQRPADPAASPGADQTAAEGQSGAAMTSDESAESARERDNSDGLGSSAAGIALSSSRIIEILQQDPDLIVELKSLMADRLQEQGVQMNAYEISDEMLYDRIAASLDLRTGITAFLRARGYVSEDDIQAAEPEQASEYARNGISAAQRTPSLADGPSGYEFAAGAGLEPGQFSIDGEALQSSAAQPMNYARARPVTPQYEPRPEVTNLSTDAPKVLRQPAPYNLQSMRDLYTQIPGSTERLKRFGCEVFQDREAGAAARGTSVRDTPLDVPLGPDYVLGPGDSLTIDLWGSATESFTRVIDRDGRIFLPESAPVEVAGLPLERAQSAIEAVLKQQYRNAQVAVTVSHLRSVRVYVVGDVQRPGGYDISSLATPLSALYAAGGPTSAGSLRTLLHYRGKQLVEDVDLYDFLLHGIRNGSARFESGDTLLVPPAGAQVAVSGAVKRPAIYELKTADSTLASVIDDAAGLTSAASPGHVKIERIGANHERETVSVNLGNEGPEASRTAMTAFQVRDGDRIRVEPILPYSARVVYLEGHVVRPGRLPYSDGMRLSNALHSYRDMLPEPAPHGEIVRLVAPDLHAETIAFNVPDVLIGNADLDLQPFDTIRVFGRYEADPPKVTILGEVLRPGVYPMSTGMTAAQLVRMAGGFKRDALEESADLTSYDVVNGDGIAGNLATVRIGAAVSGADAQADVRLKPGDILMIHQITGWNEIGQSVSIEGQVKFPGSYGLQEGERLSSVLRRAGGFLPAAYPMGAVLVREQVRDLEQKSRDALIRQIETNSAAARLSPTLAGANSGASLQTIKTQQDEVIAELRNHPPTGRMVIQITADIDSWANTPADVELRRGDVVTMPKRPGFVLVTGQVYNATALAYTPDKTAGWYLGQAGGANTTADRKEIFIIRANGSVVGRRSGAWLEGDVLSTRLNPGDVVVVPQKIIGASLFWRNLLTTGQLAASFAITAGVAAATL
ncbi:MAG: SLBB domain-containing protein [Terracidiphilus sp.]